MNRQIDFFMLRGVAWRGSAGLGEAVQGLVRFGSARSGGAR